MNNLDEEFQRQQATYARLGLGRNSDLGTRPALLVIDMCVGITEDHTSPMYIEMSESIQHISRIASIMRDAGYPVVFTKVAYTAPHFSDGGQLIRKAPHLRLLARGATATSIDSRLAVTEDDTTIEKQYPSSFYGTGLHSLLTFRNVDTVIVTGNSTSGCVRATVTDAVSGGFSVLVPNECVADRAPLSHRVNLLDINAKYGDVVSVGDVIDYIQNLDNSD